MVSVMRGVVRACYRRRFRVIHRMLFQVARNRFGGRRNYRSLRRFGLKRFGVRHRGGRLSPGCAQGSRLVGFGCGGCRGGLSRFFALRLKRLALHFPHLFFESIPEIDGGLAELGHQFPQTPGKLRELLWSKDNEDHDEKNDHVGDA